MAVQALQKIFPVPFSFDKLKLKSYDSPNTTVSFLTFLEINMKVYTDYFCTKGFNIKTFNIGFENI
jgi:hypothetical protein